jgi:hypothetical protein
MGARAATGVYLAILDDDDEWFPDKIRRQMQIVQDLSLRGKEFIISSRAQCRSDDGSIVICPEVLYQSGMDLSEYIFERKTPMARPGFIGSGTYLMPRSLVMRVPFPSEAAHEELSWLLLCVSRDRVPLVMAEEALFIYHLHSGTRNHTQNWRASLDFAHTYRKYISDRALPVCCPPLRRGVRSVKRASGPCWRSDR